MPRIDARLFGSLAWTGKGHAPDNAVALGLSGRTPDRIEPDEVNQLFNEIRERHQIELPGGHTRSFDPDKHIIFDTKRQFDRHPNSMEFLVLDEDANIISTEVWLSVGGGFIERLGDKGKQDDLEYGAGFTFRSSRGFS